uniref:Uncharacterized protein n=1 Tax=Magallana gigas TaxID=29159 RepID=A0A8W8I8R4_MAGGI
MKTNIELYEMISQRKRYLTEMFILVKSLISAQKTSSTSNNSRFFSLRAPKQRLTSSLGAIPAEADIRESLCHEIRTRHERSRTNAELTPRSSCSSVRCPSPSMKQYQWLCLSLVLSNSSLSHKSRMEKTTILLITPAWTTQTKCATRHMMSDLLAIHPQTLMAPNGQIHPLLQNESPN